MSQVQQKLEQVAGVSRVLHKETKDGRERFTVESLQGRQIRPELARAVIESGWNLNELRSVGLSLEEIFLQLTSEHKPEEDAPAPEAAADLSLRRIRRSAMNVLTICRKELSSYFRSPIAYGVMFFFALIAGYFFYVATVSFVHAGPASRDDGTIPAHGRQ